MQKIRKNTFNKNQRVSIIRHRHGWSDGAVQGKIKEINFRPTGTAYYTVISDDGLEYHVERTKDLRAI